MFVLLCCNSVTTPTAGSTSDIVLCCLNLLPAALPGDPYRFIKTSDRIGMLEGAKVQIKFSVF